jgi:hypothetical protein
LRSFEVNEEMFPSRGSFKECKIDPEASAPMLQDENVKR